MQSNSERPSPEIQYTLGNGEVATMTYYNTDVYTYDKPFHQMNHAYYHPEEHSGGYIFGDQELVRNLIRNKFPRHKYAWPDQNDENAYIACYVQDMDEDLDKLLGGSNES